MKEYSKQIIFSLLVLIFILTNSVLNNQVSFGRATVVFTIILALMAPHIIFAKFIITKKVWYKSKLLHLANVIFIISWIYFCFAFYRKSPEIGFLDFYKPHISNPSAFTWVMLGGMFYSLIMANIALKNLNERHHKVEDDEDEV
tara:strand:- start:387 stop:818 length:432 start_codon:yes stop_codon:yes gene_type:complete